MPAVPPNAPTRATGAIPRKVGRYRIERRLAVGGMAEVFLARMNGPAAFEKPAVIKVLLPQHWDRPKLRRMFEDEARLLGQLSHPNITHVYELGHLDPHSHHGAPFLAMEYVDGKTLSAILSRATAQGHTLPAGFVAGVLADAAHGLHFAHSLRDSSGKPLHVVHRDVSPSNLMVTKTGTVKVADFGIAKSEIQSQRTENGALKGKIAYMAPEQAAGLEVDGRTDVFSLGVVGFELLTGRRLYEGANDMAILKQVLKGKTPRRRDFPSSAPLSLVDVVTRALNPKPAGRFTDAEAFALALEACSPGHGDVERRRFMRRLYPEPSPTETDRGGPRLPQAVASRVQTAPCIEGATANPGLTSSLATTETDHEIKAGRMTSEDLGNEAKPAPPVLGKWRLSFALAAGAAGVAATVLLGVQLGEQPRTLNNDHSASVIRDTLPTTLIPDRLTTGGPVVPVPLTPSSTDKSEGQQQDPIHKALENRPSPTSQEKIVRRPTRQRFPTSQKQASATGTKARAKRAKAGITNRERQRQSRLSKQPKPPKIPRKANVEPAHSKTNTLWNPDSILLPAAP